MFERYYHDLHHFISRSIGCRDKAQDVVQEAYARVLASDHKDSALGALLYTTAKNIVIDQYRQNKSRQYDNYEQLELAASRADEPEQRAAGRQSMNHLLELIDTLPPRSKEAFVLYKFDGLSHAEIAKQMGISINMVEKHIINAMVSCKKGMAARGGK
ncbi:RNA polymerase sigma factor [Janthinobacterium sp. B9-8]|uniref:RNA polymerase sigma factor n=1 Tax=Janthinobacterium sp. B9-8 TaxID=1236179 RepID=UPI00061CF03D|nr:sigma-70 family RNA polymerase sigma factor [Janthinobacterium sp. B9-8]AMC33499.1 RNA polymerase subunit sigma-24 [Janthinobacterium sp. B9-8]